MTRQQRLQIFHFPYYLEAPPLSQSFSEGDWLSSRDLYFSYWQHKTSSKETFIYRRYMGIGE